MTVRMRVLRRAWMTAVVCGFSRFLRTSSPRRLSSCSKVSLEGGWTQVRGHRVAQDPVPASGQGSLSHPPAPVHPPTLGAPSREAPPAPPTPGPEAQFPGRGGDSPPRQLLSGLQAGCHGQRLAGKGHHAVASGRVALQPLGEVRGHCRGEAGVTRTRSWGPAPFWAAVACPLHLSRACRGLPPAQGSP